MHSHAHTRVYCQRILGRIARIGVSAYGTPAGNPFNPLLKTDLPKQAQALVAKLQSILRGSRDPALADDEALDFDDAAELVLLLEKL